MFKLRKAICNLLAKSIRSEQFFFSDSNNAKVDYNSIYVPHPFTNWSLNPHYHAEGKHQHTMEGFRKTSNSNSVKEYVQNSDYQTQTFFCVGGSSTYCTDIASGSTPRVLDYHMTWPFKLQEKLNNTVSKKVVVVNGGVGGWGTLQSMIRFSVWGPILNPELTIIYQSKNDLTPFLNGRGGEKEIFPLYENIMLQFASQLHSYKLLRTICPKDLGTVVYSDQILTHPNGMQRFSSEFAELTYGRYCMIADLARTWKGKVLFIPEIIDKSSIYFPQMQLLHRKMEETVQERDWCEYFDIINVFPDHSKLFIDKMHFSEEGCEVFSDLLIQTILRTFQSI